MAIKTQAMKRANTVNNEVELEQKKKALKPISEEELKQCNMIDLIEMLTERLKDCRFDKRTLELCQPMLDKLAARFRISDTQAMMLAVGVEHPSGLDVNDVATFFSCSNVRASSYFRQCRALEKAGIMCKRNMLGEDNYYITEAADDALQTDREFVAIWDKKYTADEFVDRVQNVFSIMEDQELDYVDGVEMLKRYFRSNTHLTCVSEINELHLPPLEFIVLVLMCHSVVNDRVTSTPFLSIYNMTRGRDYRKFHKEIYDGCNLLQVRGLVEFKEGDGMAIADQLQITDKVKNEVLAEYDIEEVFNPRTKNGLLNYEDLAEKPLFYNDREAKQVSRLHELITEEKYKEVCDRMKKAGMRTGVTCLFYGAPGTGKTETVYQLARQTGRYIMEVNVDKIKDKFVGESEKNMRSVFETYRKKVRSMKNAPILLFNEADAIFSKRITNVDHSVDQMNNAIQNIILQEMEKFEGIIIATTNLTTNLDKAFERRFFYKIKFDNPSAEAKSRIWQSMIPELTDAQALQLAKTYDFSGGQIENVSRKQKVNAIINDCDFSFDDIIAYCDEERIGTTTHHRVGF